MARNGKQILMHSLSEVHQSVDTTNFNTDLAGEEYFLFLARLTW